MLTLHFFRMLPLQEFPVQLHVVCSCIYAMFKPIGIFLAWALDTVEIRQISLVSF